jgi:hypothetical protein
MKSESWQPVRFWGPVLVVVSYLFGSFTSPLDLYASDSNKSINLPQRADLQGTTSRATSSVGTTRNEAEINLEQVSIFPQISSSFKPSNPLIPISMKNYATCRECHNTKLTKEKRRYGMNL